MSPNRPIVALDIDGTLGDYHRNFLRFAALYFGIDEPNENWIPETTNPGLPLWQHMGISHRDYRDAKLAYRQGGWKRWMPVYPGAAELTAEIRAAGAEVWLCTTRPYLRLDNVDPDTREWLRRNKIQYDAILFDPLHEEDGSKYHELARQAGPRVVSVVDDLPEMIEAARSALPQIDPVIRDQPYNRHLIDPRLRRARSTADIWTCVLRDLCKWKEANR